MLYCNDDKMFEFDLDKMYVVADFNKTFTKGNSKTTWSIFATSDIFDENYTRERNELFEIYYPFEIDKNLDDRTKKDKLSEWWQLHLDLFPKYKLNEKLIKQALEEDNIMELRDGVKEFLSFLNDKNIPLIINTQGIGNFAKTFLEMNECYFDNIYMSSNMIEFDNGIACGSKGTVIHSFNKDEVILPKEIIARLEGKNQILLLGDELTDLKMVDISKRDNTLRVGILTEKHKYDLDEYKEHFDIIFDDSVSYNEIGKKLLAGYKG